MRASTALLLLVAFTATVQAADRDADGGISLKSVLPVKDAAPVANRARQLMSELRQSRYHHVAASAPSKIPPSTVPPVPSASRRNSTTKLKTIRPRGVLLTSGQDAAASIQIPELLPPPVPGLADSQVSSVVAGREIVPSAACECQDCRLKRSGKRGVRRGGVGQKIKAGAQRVLSCFVEVEECDEVHFDVDDYHMPILLVAASDEASESQDDDLQDRDNPAAGLLSRKLTDIQPTLAYAYGEKDARVLPEAFYKKIDHGVYEQQVGPKMVLQWEPTNLWYHPLYFQDTGLERYGHTHKPWVQPFVSTGTFFGQVVTLPYRMTLDPPHCQQYALGYYQPGEWAPKKKYQLPFNEEAAATQFLWMTGFFLLIP